MIDGMKLLVIFGLPYTAKVMRLLYNIDTAMYPVHVPRCLCSTRWGTAAQ